MKRLTDGSRRGEHEDLSRWLLWVAAPHKCVDRVQRVLDPSFDYLDFPVAGVALFAMGAWGLLQERLQAEDAARLLVYAERFAYNGVPTMAWERIAPHAEEKAPGQLAKVQNKLEERRGPELPDEVRTFVEKLGSTRG